MASFPTTTRATAVTYLHHDDSFSEPMKGNCSVTVASTIVDQQGIVKAVIHPRFVNNPYPMIFCPYLSRSIDKHRSEQCLIPIRYNPQRTKINVDRQLSLLFFWSMPLRAQIFQLCTRATRIENVSTRFERHPVKISIGIQNGNGDGETTGLSQLRYYNRSEIALSNTDEGFDQSHSLSLIDREDTFDSLTFNPIVNDHIIPIGILKKKKFDDDEWNSKKRRSDCYETSSKIVSDANVSWTDETTMRSQILANVNLCVDHLSRLLGETCSNRLASNNNYQQLSSSSQVVVRSKERKKNHRFTPMMFITKMSLVSFQKFSDDQRSIIIENNDNHDRSDRLILKDTDGIVLHRGEQFGKDLGDPMIRISDRLNECHCQHPIEMLNPILSPSTCQRMRQYQIETIEDLLRLFLHQENNRFNQLMINYFHLDPLHLNELNTILMNWSKS